MLMVASGYMENGRRGCQWSPLWTDTQQLMPSTSMTSEFFFSSSATSLRASSCRLALVFTHLCRATFARFPCPSLRSLTSRHANSLCSSGWSRARASCRAGTLLHRARGWVMYADVSMRPAHRMASSKGRTTCSGSTPCTTAAHDG